MIATVTWIGGLAILSFFIFPIAEKSLNIESYSTLVYKINKKLNPISWFGLIVLTVTGLIQMAANTNYDGILKIGNPWATAILAKHAVFVIIIGVSAYQSWTITPELESAQVSL